jgi:hypothetical protein
MNKNKKGALFGLLLFVPGLIIIGFSMCIVAYTAPVKNSYVFWPGMWGFCVWLNLMWAIGAFKKPNPSYDERDLMISKRSLLIGYFVMSVYFITAGIFICWRFDPMGSIPPVLLLAVIFSGLILFTLTQSLAVLIQYGWEGKHIDLQEGLK